jgi:predicted dehydrogenase
MTNIAVCGLGNIGKVHLQNLLSLRGCRVAGVFDRNAEERERLAGQHSLRAYRSWDELLADPAVDAVVIATPTGSHRELGCSALAAGKHVFLEKPLAGTLADSTAIVEAAESSDRVVQVGFCERFNAAHLEARRAVVEGRLGCLRAIQSSRVTPYHLGDPTWELGVLDTAVHNLDLILWLIGRLPASVRASGAKVYDDAMPYHTCVSLLTFEDGTLAADHIAWVREEAHPFAHCAQSQLFLQGDRGAFRVDHMTRPAWVMDERRFAGVDTLILGGPEYYGCLKLQFDHFLRVIEGEAAPTATAAEALAAERVALAARESLRSGGDVALDRAADGSGFGIGPGSP